MPKMNRKVIIGFFFTSLKYPVFPLKYPVCIFCLWKYPVCIFCHSKYPVCTFEISGLYIWNTENIRFVYFVIWNIRFVHLKCTNRIFWMTKYTNRIFSVFQMYKPDISFCWLGDMKYLWPFQITPLNQTEVFFLHTQKKMVQTLNLAHIKDELMRAQKRKFDPLNLPKIELLNF